MGSWAAWLYPWWFAGRSRFCDGPLLINPSFPCSERCPMPRERISWLLCGAIAVLGIGSAAASALAMPPGEVNEEFFETRIRPVLANSCVECHGPATASSGLRLDTRTAMLKGGERGPAIVPGDPEGSLLVRAIVHEENQPLQMPPEDPLPANVVADFK